MIKSMTAFGRAEKTVEGRTFIVEIRSLNSRYGEVIVRMPPQFLPFEGQIKKLVMTKISRGRAVVQRRLVIFVLIFPWPKLIMEPCAN
jgi:uncharacterized protein (TIGR00255 family)